MPRVSFNRLVQIWPKSGRINVAFIFLQALTLPSCIGVSKESSRGLKTSGSGQDGASNPSTDETPDSSNPSARPGDDSEGKPENYIVRPTIPNPNKITVKKGSLILEAPGGTFKFPQNPSDEAPPNPDPGWVKLFEMPAAEVQGLALSGVTYVDPLPPTAKPMGYFPISPDGGLHIRLDEYVSFPQSVILGITTLNPEDSSIALGKQGEAAAFVAVVNSNGAPATGLYHCTPAQRIETVAKIPGQPLSIRALTMKNGTSLLFMRTKGPNSRTLAIHRSSEKWGSMIDLGAWINESQIAGGSIAIAIGTEQPSPYKQVVRYRTFRNGTWESPKGVESEAEDLTSPLSTDWASAAIMETPTAEIPVIAYLYIVGDQQYLRGKMIRNDDPLTSPPKYDYFVPGAPTVRDTRISIHPGSEWALISALMKPSPKPFWVTLGGYFPLSDAQEGDSDQQPLLLGLSPKNLSMQTSDRRNFVSSVEVSQKIKINSFESTQWNPNTAKEFEGSFPIMEHPERIIYQGAQVAQIFDANKHRLIDNLLIGQPAFAVFEDRMIAAIIDNKNSTIVINQSLKSGEDWAHCSSYRSSGIDTAVIPAVSINPLDKSANTFWVEQISGQWYLREARL
jgi:hypothetical protein